MSFLEELNLPTVSVCELSNDRWQVISREAGEDIIRTAQTGGEESKGGEAGQDGE